MTALPGLSPAAARLRLAGAAASGGSFLRGRFAPFDGGRQPLVAGTGQVVGLEVGRRPTPDFGSMKEAGV